MSRLTKALIAALALHGLLLLVRARHSPNASAAHTPPASELVEVEAPPLEEAPPESAQTTDDARSASPSTARATLAARAGERAPDPTAPGTEGPGADGLATDGATAGVITAPEAVASADAPARKIDLGLDGHFFMKPPSEELPRVHKSEFQHQLEASIAADDVKHGLARGNALLGSLHSAIRDAGPVRGEAVVRVTVAADGSLSDVEFLQGAADDWSAALKAFRALAASKRVRVPSGARGLRVTFSLKAKVQLPSGEEVKGPHFAGASLEPGGLVPHGTFDVADIGSGPQRLVYARVVSEEVL